MLTIDFNYEEGSNGPFRPVVRNVVLENVTTRASPRAMWVTGFPGAVIDDVRFANCAFRGVREAEVLQDAGFISFNHVTIEPAIKSLSRSSRPAE